MIWLWLALVCLGLVLFFFEGIRRAGYLYQAQPWLRTIGIGVPLLFGAYVGLTQRHDCTAIAPAMGLGLDLGLDRDLGLDLSEASLEERYETLNTLKDEVSAKLRNCGGSPSRWHLYGNLEILVLELEQQINTQFLEIR